MCKPRDQKWRHNEVITKINGRQWENTDLVGTKQNIYRSKGFDENVIFIEFEPLCQSYGHLCQIYQKRSPNMVMSRDPGFKFRKFWFFA